MKTFERLLPQQQEEIKRQVLEQFKKEGIDASELQEHIWRVELSCLMTFEVEVDAETEKEAVSNAIREAEEDCLDAMDWRVEKITKLDENDTVQKQFQEALEEEAQKVLVPEHPNQIKIW